MKAKMSHLGLTRPPPFQHAVGNEDITASKPHSSTGSTETKTLKADGVKFGTIKFDV